MQKLQVWPLQDGPVSLNFFFKKAKLLAFY